MLTRRQLIAGMAGTFLLPDIAGDDFEWELWITPS